MTEDDALRAFCDLLIPGAENWPSASAALEDPIRLDLADMDGEWLLGRATDLARLPVPDRLPAMQALEQTDPEHFDRVLSALYGAYYLSAAGHAAVARRAACSPQEPSPHFDATLLRQVISTKAGAMRR